MSGTRSAGAVALIVLAVPGCMRADPGATLSTGQALIELSDAINDIRQESAILQEQVDSLRQAVARQDTVIAGLVMRGTQ